MVWTHRTTDDLDLLSLLPHMVELAHSPFPLVLPSPLIHTFTGTATSTLFVFPAEDCFLSRRSAR